MPRPISSAHPRERGYALLLIFLMAALVAISMYTVLPRVAFEAQRDKEQLLVDRGEQYKRAIQLFYRKLHKYPVKMEDLENTNNTRFLRDRYTDPLTGKDEWRLIHVGPGGVFTDSLTQKNNSAKKDVSSVNNFVGELKGLGDLSTSTDNDGVNVGLRRRASDPGGSDASSDPNALPTTDPNAPPGVPGINVPMPSQAGTTSGTGSNISSSSMASGTGLGQSAPATPGSSGNGADMIRNLLTSPRPGGAPPGILGSSDQSASNSDGSSQSTGFTSTTPTSVLGGNPAQGSSAPGQALGNSAGTFATGSFAGVASTVKRPGIKIYADHKKYNEWEFIYDYGKDPAFGGGGVMPIPNNPNNPNNANNPNNNSANPANNTANPATGATGTSTTTGVGGSTTTGTPAPATATPIAN